MPLSPIGRYFISRTGSIQQKALSAALPVGLTAMDVYRQRRESPERPMAESMLKASGTFALWTFFPQVGFIHAFGKGAVSIGAAVGRLAGSQVKEPGYRDSIGQDFFDNPAKATMRRRAVAAAQESKINAHSVLGNEARRIGRGYFEL